MADSKKPVAKTKQEPVTEPVVEQKPKPLVCSICDAEINTVDDHILEAHRGFDLEELLDKIRVQWYGGGWD